MYDNEFRKPEGFASQRNALREHRSARLVERVQYRFVQNEQQERSSDASTTIVRGMPTRYRINRLPVYHLKPQILQWLFLLLAF